MQRFRCRTQRRSGATEIRVIAATSEEAARARLIAAGLEPVEIEPMAASLFDGLRARLATGVSLPDWDVPAIALPRGPHLIAAWLLLSIPVSVAIGSWLQVAMATAESDRLQARYRREADGPMLSMAARDDLARALSKPTIGNVVVRLAATLPADASVYAIGDDDQRGLRIEIDTSDPDRLREALKVDPMIGRLREIGQVRTEQGMIRITLQGDSQ